MLQLPTPTELKMKLNFIKISSRSPSVHGGANSVLKHSRNESSMITFVYPRAEGVMIKC